jgi:Ca-activated chloride channel family protein
MAGRLAFTATSRDAVYGWARTLILALARPQAVVSLPRIQGIVILAFDVSASMAAEDIQPSRIEAARTAAQEFVNNQPVDVLVGVVAFSDNGLSVQVPTSEKEALLAALARLAPSRGTSLANGIIASLTTIDATNNPPETHYYSNITRNLPPPHAHAGWIVLRRSSSCLRMAKTQTDPFAAQAAADRVRIYTVGVPCAAKADLEDRVSPFTQLDEACCNNQRSAECVLQRHERAELRQIYRTSTCNG